MATYIDQYNDKSGRVLIKIASTLNDQDLASRAIDMFFNNQNLDSLEKTAEDVILSTLYFMDQEDKMAPDEARRMSEKLAALRELYNVNEDFSRVPKFAKEADETPSIDLLPGKPVSSKYELIKAGEEFDKHKNWMREEDKITFAQNFMKAAEEFEVDEVPQSVCLYSLTNVVPREDLEDGIRLHKMAAAFPMGSEDTVFDHLIGCSECSEHDIEGLFKLAQLLDTLDTEFDVRNRSRQGRTVPSGLETVFRVKTAEEDSKPNDEKAKKMDKADVVAQFGVDSLDDIENIDGTINKERLKSLMEMFNNGHKSDK